MAPERAPAYQWYPKDFENDEAVKLMTYEQEGIYRRLLDHQALHGSIPSELKHIAMLCPKVSQKRFASLWAGIAGRFDLISGRLVNAKLEKVKARTAAFKAMKAAAGRESAVARAAEQNGNREPNRSATESRTEGATRPQPSSATATALATALATQKQLAKFSN